MSHLVVLKEHVQFCFKVLIAHLEKKPHPTPNLPNDE
jgi:hypothetical protein